MLGNASAQEWGALGERIASHPGTERDELDRLRQRHPWIDAEIDDLRAVTDRLRAAETTWDDPGATGALRDRVLGQIPTARDGVDEPDGTPAIGPVVAPARATPAATARRRRWVTPLVAAACLVVGIALGVGTPALLSVSPSGPPGTLGALEQIDVRDEIAGIDVDADLVAHTWGTEAVLDATGLAVGETYSVVFVGADGAEFSAGQMLGSEVAIHCRLNAAVLRDDAVRMEIRDADATVVALAELPEV